MLDTGWMADANCAGLDMGYSELDEELSLGRSLAQAREVVTLAKRVCGNCPVAALCLNYALETETNSTRYGIWGGMTPNERAKLRRRQPASSSA